MRVPVPETLLPADQLGTVEAPTAEAAIKQAIKQFQITEPWEQERIAARPNG